MYIRCPLQYQNVTNLADLLKKFNISPLIQNSSTVLGQKIKGQGRAGIFCYWQL